MNILAAIEPIIERARWVSIDSGAIDEFASQLASSEEPLPEWDGDLHPAGRDDEETATLVLVLDALNFCFWPMPGSSPRRWTVSYRGRAYDGYLALAVALRKAVEQDTPLSDPEYLATLDLRRVRDLLAPDSGAQEIPLIDERLTNLREVGEALRDRWDGSFASAIRDANGSATDLIGKVIEALPSFRDSAAYRGREILFYKRAQILIADLHGALGGAGLGRFHDLDQLTAFADYKVPQILRYLGVLRYQPSLAEAIQRYELIPPGDEREIEIRAATVWAVELLRRSLARHNRNLNAYKLDWLLWNASQSMPPNTEPYHRTLTIYY